MGSGRWNASVYNSVTTSKVASGSTFAYSGTTMAQSFDQRKAHADLDPKGIDVRESRDSDEHPTTVAIAVFFDVTGSMRTVPRQLQKALPELLGQVLDNGYVEHPQILFGAVGDKYSDAIPLQIGQFESDNRMDDQLDLLVLEGGGGGSFEESYELALYAAARHTSIDCEEKRGHKGYLFLIGDETAYPTVDAKTVAKVFDDGLQSDIPLADILAEAQQKYEVHFIIPGGSSHFSNQKLKDFWTDLLGQNVHYVDGVDVIAKEIAHIIGVGEGTA